MSEAVNPTRIVTATESADLADRMNNFTGAAWPEFMRQDPVSNVYWHRLYRDFAAFQFAIVDSSDAILAVGNSVPLSWSEPYDNLPDTGWDWELESSFKHFDDGLTPNTLGAIQIVVDPKLRGSGLSRRMVLAMRAIAVEHGFSALVAPVRPNQKHLYPLTPMCRYVQWRRADGSLYDAWLRVHESLGAKLIKVCHHAMTIPGAIEQWEKWTGMIFPESDQYIVPFALTPVAIDREANRGVYIEPNVWMVHPIAP